MNEIHKKLENHHQLIGIFNNLIKDAELELINSLNHLIGKKVIISDDHDIGTCIGLYRGYYTNGNMYVGVTILFENGRRANLSSTLVTFIDE